MNRLDKKIRSRIVVNPLSQCWEWQGVLTHNGYPLLSINGKCKRAHRVIFELLGGVIPEGFTLDHLCRVRHCVNPKHLEAVSLKVNIMRGNGLTAVNRLKTHCLRGHVFDKANTRVYKGTRFCRKCVQIRKKRYINPNPRKERHADTGNM